MRSHLEGFIGDGLTVHVHLTLHTSPTEIFSATRVGQGQTKNATPFTPSQPPLPTLLPLPTTRVNLHDPTEAIYSIYARPLCLGPDVP